MIEIKEVTYLIVDKLYQYTERLVVPTDGEGKRPEYPFLSYKVTTLYNPPPNQGNHHKGLIESSDNRFENDILETLEIQFSSTISFNAYSEDIIECQALAKKAYDWFKFVGYRDLKEINVIVIDVDPITDRSLLMVDNYEYRYGFDVRIRAAHFIERRIETIEEYSIRRLEGNED